MTAEGRRIFHGVFAILFAAATVLSSFEISSANRDAAQAAAFAAAPSCPPATVPVGNCAGWEQETVSSVEVATKGGSTTVRLSAGGQTLWYRDYNTWASGLTAGASVSVLVWRNQAQALRDPTGEILYSDSSVQFNRYDEIAAAVCPFGSVLGFYVCFGALDVPPLRIRRPRLWLSLNVIGGSAGAGLFAAGATIQVAKSVDPGIIVGVIAFALVALVTTGIVALVAANSDTNG
jgi:hypothetical protein